MDQTRTHSQLGAVERRAAPAANAVQWIIVGLSLAWNLLIGPYTGQPDTRILFTLVLPFMLLHGVRRYGLAAMAVYVVSALVVSNLYENASILTGFPFGHYHYTGTEKLFLVPVVIGPFYVAIGYVSWQTANALLGVVDGRLRRRLDVVLLPAVAAAAMTMFDLATDPSASTLGHTWVWHDGGGFFGVPVTNFMGWWLCTYTFFQVFAAYLARRGHPAPPHPLSFWLQPVILYCNLGLSTVVQFLTAKHGAPSVSALNGVWWRPDDIREASVTVFLFTMLVITVLALARLAELALPGAASTASPVGPKGSGARRPGRR